MDRHIQDVLQKMLKTQTSGDAINDIIVQIATCIDKIIYETQGTLDISTSMPNSMIDDADAIVADLGDINNELLDLGEDLIDSPGDRDITQKIANTCYETAKISKDLLGLFEA